jgi:NAD(P)-dependent dehydrogenase (short-subunit alcohol dehydrogenase family)
MQTLTGNVAVVTGGGGGIGAALAERFGHEGMKVVVADILPEPLEAVAESLRDKGFDAIGVVTDVTSFESVCALRDATLDRFGAVHVVCNNAGVGSGAKGRMWEHHLNDWRWSFDVNVYGVIHGINAFVPVMLAQGTEGHVVNTSSGNGGFTPMAQNAIYPVTKAAVVTLTECLWGQLRAIDAKVSASVLFPSTRSPGIMNTGIWKAGANRPPRYARPGDEEPAGRDALEMFREQMAAMGKEVLFAPLEEVADMCVEGIKTDNFWITAPSEFQHAALRDRVESQIGQSPPNYLLGNSMNAMGSRVSK